jgi:hypothetical protein
VHVCEFVNVCLCVPANLQAVLLPLTYGSVHLNSGTCPHLKCVLSVCRCAICVFWYAWVGLVKGASVGVGVGVGVGHVCFVGGTLLEKEAKHKI